MKNSNLKKISSRNQSDIKDFSTPTSRKSKVKDETPRKCVCAGKKPPVYKAPKKNKSIIPKKISINLYSPKHQ